MTRTGIVVVALTGLLAGCSLAGQLTVKDYRAKTGERVVAGQVEPKSEYVCQEVSKESADRDWGLREGMLNKEKAIERITTEAVDAAPGKGANYAYIIFPSSFGPPGINVNAFRDVSVAHYSCQNLPDPKD